MTKVRAGRELRIVHLEDDLADADLVKETLQGAGFELAIHRVETAEELIKIIGTWGPDAVLADYKLPSFDGLSALKLVREKFPDLPFILISGTLGDELAVEVVKSGATDYLLKDRLSRLPMALEKALIETDELRRLREAERAVRESEARLREITENIREIFWVLSPELDRVLYVNAAFERIWGRSRAGLENATAAELLLGAIHPEDRDRVTGDFSKMKSQEWEIEHRIVRPDGGVRWMRSRSFPVRDAQGRLVRVIGVSEDVTDRRTLEEELRQAQKMEALGRLASGVAHDFNNLLTVILGYGQMLLSQLPEGDASRAKVKEMYEAGERAVTLTRQLLAFSRKQVVRVRSLDLGKVLAGLEKMLARLVGEDIAVSVHPDRDLWPVLADPGQVEQVVINLVVNARDAMPSGGKLSIETRNVELAEDYARGRLEARPGPHVMLSVSDTGSGMDQEVMRHLFEPFFTTKEVGKGTGLGLSTVYGIVKQVGGHIGVYSEVGRGTTFKIYFPRLKAERKGTEEIVRTAEPLRGTGTLLVVEDSATVRRLLTEILAQLGYKVLAAGHGAEALELLKTHEGPIDLLITDVVMPGLGGPELALHATRVRPGIRILFVSGYSEHAFEDQVGQAATVDFLQKPFTADAISAKVRDILSGKETP